ncbi:MAG: hypothetical protein AMXMBFR84_13670 [Candidatus Hydrogenedentota bacterium]
MTASVEHHSYLTFNLPAHLAQRARKFRGDDAFRRDAPLHEPFQPTKRLPTQAVGVARKTNSRLLTTITPEERLLE